MCAGQSPNHFERAQTVGCCIAHVAATWKALRRHVLMGNGDRIHDPRHARHLESDRLGRPAFNPCGFESISFPAARIAFAIGTFPLSDAVTITRKIGSMSPFHSYSSVRFV
jgi:hypothetical protein